MRYAIALLAALWLPSIASAQTIAWTLVVTDMANTPVTTVNVGEAFKLRVFVADVRPVATGVFAAYVDVTYNVGLAATNGAIVHSDTYDISTSGTSSSGLLDEVGGTDGFTPLGPGQFLVFEQAFTASAPGDLTFVTDRPDVTPSHNNLVYGSNTAVPPGDIAEDAVTLTIAGDPGFLFDDSFEGDPVTP